MSGEKWLLEYDACARHGQEILEKIHNRNREARGSSSYTKQTSHLRYEMRDFSRDLSGLREDLMRSARISSVTQRELERRQAMLDQLITKERHIEQYFSNEDRGDFNQRSVLMGRSKNPFDDPWSRSAPAHEDPGFLSVDQFRQQQQQVIREQDQGLESLSNVLDQQRQMALCIGTEVEGQNELIDDVRDHVDGTNQRLIRETKHIRNVDRKSGTCCLWSVIIFLFIAVIVIALVPYNGKP